MAADLDPTTDYEAQLPSGGLRTIDGVKRADNTEQIQRACGLLLGDAITIWKAAGGFAGKQVSFCVLGTNAPAAAQQPQTSQYATHVPVTVNLRVSRLSTCESPVLGSLSTRMIS